MARVQNATTGTLMSSKEVSESKRQAVRGYALLLSFALILHLISGGSVGVTVCLLTVFARGYVEVLSGTPRKFHLAMLPASPLAFYVAVTVPSPESFAYSLCLALCGGLLIGPAASISRPEELSPTRMSKRTVPL